MRAWVANLVAKGLAPATVRKAYQLLKRVMQAAVDARYIQHSPCRNVPLPKMVRNEMRFLGAKEVQRLAEEIDPRYRALVYLGAYGGLRFGELSGLRAWRVDPARSEVRVAEILVEVRGELLFGPPKTAHSMRTIRLPRFVSDLLADHMQRYAVGPHDLAFTSPDDKPLRASNFRRRSWNPAVRAAELSPLRPHDLRHTAVALWIANGASAKQVAARAGHGSAGFTLDRYGHLFPDGDDALADELDATIKKANDSAGASVVSLRRVGAA